MLAKVAGQDVPTLEPVTREEYFLAKAAGQDVPELEPVTRKEYFLADVIEAIESGGGGSDLGTKTISENGTYKASDDSLDGYSKVTVNVPAPTGTKSISITENGTTTEDITQYADAEITVNVSGGGDTFKDYFENANNLIINSNATSVKSNGITGGNVKAIILPECMSLANGAICYASYTNSTMYFTKLDELQLPKVEALGTMSLCGIRTGCTLNSVVLPSLKTITWSASNGRAFDYSDAIIKWDFGNPSITSMSWGSGTHFYRCSPSIEAIIFRYGGVVAIGSTSVFHYNNTDNLPLGTTTFIYVPSALLAQYKTASNWASLFANYPDMFKTIEGSYYETHYADGTVIA